MNSAVKDFWWSFIRPFLIVVGVLVFLALLGIFVLAHSAEIDFGATEHNGSVESQTYHAGISASGRDISFQTRWNYGKIFNSPTIDNGNLRLGYDPSSSGP